MTQPPSHMTIELEEKDVKGDLAKVVRSMSQLGAETIRDRKLTDAQKDEYLHMTYRLASGIQAISDEQMVKRMQLVAERVTKNPSLLQYDPMQDGFWRKNDPAFSENLDDLLISIVRDDFTDVDAKHHVLQAVKYLGVEDSPFEKREEVYDTILPFQGSVQSELNEGILKRILGKLFGAQYKLEDLESLVLSVDAVKDGFSPELIDIAKEMGYSNLRVKITDKEWKRIESQLEYARIASSDQMQNNQEGINFYNKLVKYTKPISYLFLGALPRSLQDKLDNTLPDFSKRVAFSASCWTEIAGSVIGAASLAVLNNHPIYLLTGLPTLCDGIYRGFKGLDSEGDNYEESRGSVFLKPVFYPVERHLDKKPKGFKVLTIPIRKMKSSKPLPNPLAHYDRVARLEVPQDVEQNLVWSQENHHSYGKHFMEFVNSAESIPEGILISRHIDKESQSVAYSHETAVDGFAKNCALYCFNGGRRYLVTAIGKESKRKVFVENIRRILASDKDLEKKLGEMGKQTNAKYLHIIEYQNGEITRDLEG